MNASTIITYNEAVTLLDSFINYERTPPASGAAGFGTERMANLLERLESPHLVAPAVHIAGTKGKGSSASLVAAALSSTGMKTGLYVSPHVDTLRERIMVNGRPISERQFSESCQAAVKAASDMRADGHEPTWFEVLTATAFHAFNTLGVEAMVLETGMGGRLDATNVSDLRAAAVGITTISLDHENILGSTLAEIAAEKAAIIRAGVPVVVMQQEKEALKVILKRAKDIGAPVFRVGEDITASVRKKPLADRPELGQRVDMETWRSIYPDLVLSMLGDHQIQNASLALGLAELFMEGTGKGPLDSLALKRAWRGLALPARMEVYSTRPWLIVDGAHNPASAWAAAETVVNSFTSENRTLIFGASEDKNVKAMLRILAPLFKTVIVSPFESPRSVNPAKLAEFMANEYPEIQTKIAENAADALALAKKSVDVEGLILVAGSLYLAGEIRTASRNASSKRLTRKD